MSFRNQKRKIFGGENDLIKKKDEMLKKSIEFLSIKEINDDDFVQIFRVTQNNGLIEEKDLTLFEEFKRRTENVEKRKIKEEELRIYSLQYNEQERINHERYPYPLDSQKIHLPYPNTKPQYKIYNPKNFI